MEYIKKKEVIEIVNNYMKEYKEKNGENDFYNAVMKMEEYYKQKKEYSKDYYEKNKDVINEKNREYYRKKKQEGLDYYTLNKEKVCERNRKIRNERVKELREMGVKNPWAVINKGEEPRYKRDYNEKRDLESNE